MLKGTKKGMKEAMKKGNIMGIMGITTGITGITTAITGIIMVMATRMGTATTRPSAFRLTSSAYGGAQPGWN